MSHIHLSSAWLHSAALCWNMCVCVCVCVSIPMQHPYERGATRRDAFYHLGSTLCAPPPRWRLRLWLRLRGIACIHTNGCTY